MTEADEPRARSLFCCRAFVLQRRGRGVGLVRESVFMRDERGRGRAAGRQAGFVGEFIPREPGLRVGACPCARRVSEGCLGGGDAVGRLVGSGEIKGIWWMPWH